MVIRNRVVHRLAVYLAGVCVMGALLVVVWAMGAILLWWWPGAAAALGHTVPFPLWPVQLMAGLGVIIAVFALRAPAILLLLILGELGEDVLRAIGVTGRDVPDTE